MNKTPWYIGQLIFNIILTSLYLYAGEGSSFASCIYGFVIGNLLISRDQAMEGFIEIDPDDPFFEIKLSFTAMLNYSDVLEKSGGKGYRQSYWDELIYSHWSW